MSSNRRCFFCKREFLSSEFSNHLKNCHFRKLNNSVLSQGRIRLSNGQNWSLDKINEKIDQLWQCNMCSFNNNLNETICRMCACGKRPQNMTIINNENTWTCINCTFVNSKSSSKCKICLMAPSNIQTTESTKNNNVYADTEDDTLKLLQKITVVVDGNICHLCEMKAGSKLPCNHNVCDECLTQYILKGISTYKWRSEHISCPNHSDCKDGTIPSDLLEKCNLNEGMRKKFVEMQNQYIASIDPMKCLCPKCKIVVSIPENQMCDCLACGMTWCDKCEEMPYHSNYTCEQYIDLICRFCKIELNSNNKLRNISMAICNSVECMKNSKMICNVKFECGHYCIGLTGQKCFGCIHPKCTAKDEYFTDDEWCNICWVDPLSAAPTVKLNCGHYFHYLCLKQKVEQGWLGEKITFGFLNCPLCKASVVGHTFWTNQDKRMIVPPYIQHIEIHVFKNKIFIPNEIKQVIELYFVIKDITQNYVQLKQKVQEMAIEIGMSQNLHGDRRLTDPNSAYFNNFAKYAMDRLAFYLCYKCKTPYYGGWRGHEEAGLEQCKYPKQYLLCASCVISDDGNYLNKSMKSNVKICEIHGTNYLKFKCKFCCSVATWFCWESTHFCDHCFQRQQRGDYMNRKMITKLPKCPGISKCTLGYIEHPANGTSEYLIGCIACIFVSKYTK